MIWFELVCQSGVLFSNPINKIAKRNIDDAARNGHFTAHLRKNVQYITNVDYLLFYFKMLLSDGFSFLDRPRSVLDRVTIKTISNGQQQQKSAQEKQKKKNKTEKKEEKLYTNTFLCQFCSGYCYYYYYYYEPIASSIERILN